MAEREESHRRLDPLGSGPISEARGLDGGCALNDLSQELSPLHAGFRKGTAFAFPCPARPVENMLMRFTNSRNGTERELLAFF